MAIAVRASGSKIPRKRSRDADGTISFFPNEVVGILSIPAINYEQLRYFYKLIRDPGGSGPVNRGWSRFGIRDMAALVQALEVCGTVEALESGRRLTRKGLPEACAALHRQGFANPLLEVGLVRVGRKVVADINGVLIDPITRQQLIRTIASDTNSYLLRLGQTFPDLASQIVAELEAQHPETTRQVRGGS